MSGESKSRIKERSPFFLERSETKRALTPVGRTDFWEGAAADLAVVSVATAIGTIAFAPYSTLIFWSSLFVGALGPLTYWQQKQLTETKDIKQTYDALVLEHRLLRGVNRRLKKNITDLSGTVERLRDLEDALVQISETEHNSVKILNKQVKKNRSILRKKKKGLKALALQNLLDVVSKAPENDLGQKINKAEMEKLINNLHRIRGLEVHDDRLQEMFAAQSFGCLLKVATNLVLEDDEEEMIFELKG